MPSTPTITPSSHRAAAGEEPALARWLLIAAALGVITLLIVVPVVNVFYNAIAPGVEDYWRAQTPESGSRLGAVGQGFGSYWNSLFTDSDTRHAIFLTLIVAPTAVLLNLVFGLAAAWAITRFQFPGRTLLTSFIDLPFAVSPVVAGLALV
jgi:sulfate transport system permease protein